MAAAIALDVIRKTGSDDGRGGYAVIILQRPGKFGDTRRTAVSASDAQDGGIALFLDFSPELGFVGEHAGLLVTYYGLY